MSDRRRPSNLAGAAISAFEQAPVPDAVTRLAISALVARTGRRLAGVHSNATSTFAHEMASWPIAVETEAANAQHYELPPAFFALVLGPQRKYSCCLYQNSGTTLAEAEEAALEETSGRANLADGQRILELGCGWGSMSLWAARRFANARITAVSNSQPQRSYIEARCAEQRISNLEVITADANTFEPSGNFDRVISIEMFEHMSNWGDLLSRVNRCLDPQGRLFLHVFTHPTAPYRFDANDPADWIGKYFFTGGIMPSRDLARQFSKSFLVEQDWQWNGRHYQRTANDWLLNFDKNSQAISRLFRDVYGADARLWMRRWRLFFLATAGLFGHNDGNVWGVSHYLMRPVR